MPSSKAVACIYAYDRNPLTDRRRELCSSVWVFKVGDGFPGKTLPLWG